MRAAAERPIVVNDTPASCGVEHRTRSVQPLRQTFSPARTQRSRGNERFTAREVWHAPGQFEMTALGASRAIAGEGTRRELGINFPNRRRNICTRFFLHCHSFARL